MTISVRKAGRKSAPEAYIGKNLNLHKCYPKVTKSNSVAVFVSELIPLVCNI